MPLGEIEEGRSISVKDLRFLPDGSVLSAGSGGVRRWDLEKQKSELFYDSNMARLDLSSNARYLLVTAGERAASNLGRTALLLFDLETATRREITTHGNSVQSVAFDPSGRIIVTGGAQGEVRVGPVTGEEPHLLLGHEGHVKSVVVSPDGRWIFSGAGSEIRQWPMPDLSQPPPHTLPLEQFLAELHSMTNLRVVEDLDSSAGWRLEVGPFSR